MNEISELCHLIASYCDDMKDIINLDTSINIRYPNLTNLIIKAHDFTNIGHVEFSDCCFFVFLLLSFELSFVIGFCKLNSPNLFHPKN